MPKNVMLAVHCKQSENVELVTPLRKYVLQNYGNHSASDLDDDLEVVATLRREVVNQNGALPALKDKMSRYYCVLSMMETRFPIAKGSDNVEVSFFWCDAFKPTKKVEQYNIYYEKAAVLFNLGAVCSQLGLQADRSTDDGVKEAAKRFQEAAGYFAALRDSAAPKVDAPRPIDISPECAGMLEKLMLAQAQECFFEKAFNDKKSAAIVSRIAKQVSIFYDDVQRKLSMAPLNQHFDRSWVAHVSVKSMMYSVEALMQNAISLTADDTALNGCGQGLARLRDAFTVLQSAKRESKQTGRELQDWVATVEEQVTVLYNKLLRENETVYLERVPNPADLPVIQGALMVKSLKPDGLDATGETLFAGIVPDTSAKAMSKYSDMVDQLVRSNLDKLEAASDEARLKLREWELPECLDALTTGSSAILPPGLRTELEEIGQNGGGQHLEDLANNLKELRRVSDAELVKVMDQLDKEAAEDEELRKQFGVRWSRAPSAALTKTLRDKVAGYRSNLSVAGESDQKLFKKLEDSLPAVRACSMEGAISLMPKLQAPIVNVSDVDPPVIVNTLRQALDMVNTLSNQRAALEEALKEEKVRDNILPKLMASSESPDALFTQELKKYDALAAEIDTNVNKSSEVLGVIAHNVSLYRQVFGYQEWRKACEAASGSIKSQLTAYKEIRDNFSEGTRFYTALQEAIKTLSQQTGDYCITRRIQRDDLLAEFQREREAHSQAERLGAMKVSDAQPYPMPPSATQQHVQHQQSTQSVQPQGGHFPAINYQYSAPSYAQPQQPPPPAQMPTYTYQQPYQQPAQQPYAYSQPASYQQPPPAGQYYAAYQPPPQQAQGYAAHTSNPVAQNPRPDANATQHNPLWGNR